MLGSVWSNFNACRPPSTGTPGRIRDLASKGAADLSKASFIALDEADKLLSPEFQVSSNEQRARRPINDAHPHTKSPELAHTRLSSHRCPPFADVTPSGRNRGAAPACATCEAPDPVVLCDLPSRRQVIP